MKILNLYAGIGGNRKLWGNEHEITAIELDAKIANKYANLYPLDNVIVSDAHEYLLDHYKEFDFIWSSPPCPTHSKTNYFTQHTRNRPVYPSMKLYEEIIFLQYFYKGKYCIENVTPYYEPLIPAQKVGRHLFWSNFYIKPIKQPKDDIGTMIKGHPNRANKKTQEDRNAVNSKLGLHILNQAQGIIQDRKIKQTELF
jgi:DNA (cytosine-5)-methyltransferase 1